MASPQVEDGFIRIANEIVEALWKVNLCPYESRVLWFILRKTYGFQKKMDWIALSQFSKNLGIDRRHIHRTLKGLLAKHMLVTDRGDKNQVSYGFQKDYGKWKVSPKKVTVTCRDDRVSPGEVIGVSPREVPTKDIITKETITKDNTLVPHKKTEAHARAADGLSSLARLWNDTCPHLPRVREVSWARRRKERLRLEERPLSEWQEVFTKIEASSFCRGSGPTGWKATYDWIIENPDNAIKVLEGKYDDAVRPVEEKRPKPKSCGSCADGLRANVQRLQPERWYPTNYACGCEAGQQYESYEKWPCNGCLALDTSQKAMLEVGMSLPVCQAYRMKAYQVKCKTWKKRLAEGN